MKKIVSLFMALIFVFSAAVVTFAAGDGKSIDSALEINWTDIKDAVRGEKELAGRFVSLDPVPAKIYVPDSYKKIELTDADYEQGIVCFFKNESINGEVAVTYLQFEGITNIEEYAKYVEQEYNAEKIEYDLINGYYAISYNYKDNDKLGFVALTTEDGCVVEFIFAPVNKEELAPYVIAMIASIMGTDDPE